MYKGVVLIGIGLTLVVLGIATFYFVPGIVLNQINQQRLIQKGTVTYQIWQHIPIPTFNKFYFFNVTNEFEVERNGAKPILKEIGPFVYRLQFDKNQVVQNSNGTVSYLEKKTWIFQPNESVNDELTVITTLNTPLVITLSLIQNAFQPIRSIMSLTLDTLSEGFFLKRTVKQLLFEGYPNFLTRFGPILNPEIPRNISSRFGYMLNKNLSKDGIYTVFSGINDISKVNQIESYKGLNHLNYWSSDQCNSLVNATNGQLWPALNSNQTSVRLFVSDICRVLKLNYEKTYQPFQDLTVKRFKLDSNTFKNSAEYKLNSCYKTKLFSPSYNQSQTNQSKKLFPSGVFDISSCQFGAPILISQPHFLDGDNFYLSTIIGLRPNSDNHSFWVDIDPFTGNTVNLAARLQLNVAINKGLESFRYRNIPNIVFPIFWQEVQMSLTPSFLKKLVSVKTLPSLLAFITFYLIVGLGMVILIIGFLIAIFSFSNKFRVNVNKFSQNETLKEDKRGILRHSLSISSKEEGLDNLVIIST